jgi:hypothetical protein
MLLSNSAMTRASEVDDGDLALNGSSPPEEYYGLLVQSWTSVLDGYVKKPRAQQTRVTSDNPTLTAGAGDSSKTIVPRVLSNVD